MAYVLNVQAALKALGTAGAPAILKWMERECGSSTKPHLVKAAIKKGVDQGILVQNKSSFSLAPKKPGDGVAAKKPASEQMLCRCPYKIEKAKSNRSYCRASKQKIEKDEIRLAPPMYFTGQDSDFRIDWYTLGALFEMFRDKPDAFWLSSVSQIACFELLPPADQALVREHVEALVAERAGTTPPWSPYTGPCWERRALVALVANDKAAFKSALEEAGADPAATRVGRPRIGDSDGEYRETDVQIHHCGSGPTDYAFDSTAQSCGLFYDPSGRMVWHGWAFGEEMLVGSCQDGGPISYYQVGATPLVHADGDSIVDIARKNGRDKLIEGIDILAPLL